VRECLRAILSSGGWLTGPHQGWVSFWDPLASRQDVERITSVAEEVSRATKRPLIAFMVHDSDIFCYWLYESGRLLDEYNSFPTYFGEEEVDEAAVAGNVDTLAKFCRAGTKPEQLAGIVKQFTVAAAEAGETPAYVFAEEALGKLAEFLELREEIVLSDCSDVEVGDADEDFEAEWVGAGEPPKSRAERGESQALGAMPRLPNSPLHEAAQRDDIATIQQLIADGADVNEVPGGMQVTALAMAAAYGTPDTLRAMVEMGADLQKRGPEGASPLRFAVQTAKIENVRALAELGADLSEEDARIGTLLHLAATVQGPPELVRLLLELGVDPSRKNETGIKAADIVRGNRESLEYIRSMLENSPTPLKSGPMEEQFKRFEEIERILSSGQP
jgi:hypothetical protein